MNLTEAEMTAILGDPSKRIEGPIQWALRNDVGPFAFFQAQVESSNGWPIFAKGSYNAESSKLAFALIHQGYGRRIYGLCLGNSHTNVDRQRVGSPHKHRWTEGDDRHAYVPSDITASILEPVAVWEQFCREASITHHGQLLSPPPMQAVFL
jgi:hypothetical protein